MTYIRFHPSNFNRPNVYKAKHDMSEHRSMYVGTTRERLRCFCLPADVRPLPEVVVEVVVDELDGNRVLASGLVSYPVYAKEGPKYCSTKDRRVKKENGGGG